MIDQDFYETVCRISPVGLFRTSPKGEMIYVSKKFEDIVNLNEEELLKNKWMESIHSDDIGLVKKTFAESVKKEKSWNLEFRFRTKNGKVTWVLGQALRINGGGKGLVGTITNINKRKNILSELRTMKETFYKTKL